eukprot:3200872-Alexandrium_andersonii.AAC.1
MRLFERLKPPYNRVRPTAAAFSVLCTAVNAPLEEVDARLRLCGGGAADLVHGSGPAPSRPTMPRRLL